MKSVNKIQIVLLSGAIILIVLLLFAKTTPPQKGEKLNEAEHAHESNVSMDEIVLEIKNNLSDLQKSEAEQLEKSFNSDVNKKTALFNIAKYWSTEIKQPIVAAYFTEKYAIDSSSEINWMEAANRYYLSTRFSTEMYKPIAFKKAIACFEKVVSINPSNIEAKISLASCFVEGTSEPMKGIGMLKEIEKTDSNNVNLQLNFAFFSQRSGQFDKAIARFEKVLKIKPDFIEAYLHLADAYERMGDKKKAVENLEKYSSLIDDTTIKNEIKEYINNLTKEISLVEKNK